MALLTAGLCSASWTDDVRRDSINKSNPDELLIWKNCSFDQALELYRLTYDKLGNYDIGNKVKRLMVTQLGESTGGFAFNNEVHKSMKIAQKKLPKLEEILFHVCPSLTSLSTSFDTNGGCDSLRSIVLNDCPNMDDKMALYITMSYGDQLESIFVNKTGITMDGVCSIGDRCGGVKNVCIGGGLLKNDTDLGEILHGFKNMECLSLMDCSAKIEFNVGGSPYTNVRFLAIESSSLQDKAVINMCKLFPNTEVLTLINCPIQGADVQKILLNLQLLTSICFDNCSLLRDGTLSYIGNNYKNFPMLKVIGVKGKSSITKEGVDKLKKLKMFAVTFAPYTPASFQNKASGNVGQKIDEKEIEIKK